MNELFAAFGIDWRLLLINCINFGLLLWALWYFLYGPVTRALEERRQKMIEGVERARESERRLQEIEESRGEMLASAGKEADAVLAEARSRASERQQEIIAAGQESAEAIVKDAQAQAAELKRQALAESKQEVAKLVVLGVEKLLHERAHKQ